LLPYLGIDPSRRYTLIGDIFMRRYVLALLILGFCAVIVACSDDTSSSETSQSKSGHTATVNAAKIIVTPWTDSLHGAGKTDLCALDAVNGQKAISGSFQLTSNQPVTFEGWVSTSDLHNPQSLSIVLQGVSDFGMKSTTGVMRSDVAQAYKSPDLMNAGYKADLPELSVSAGSYSVLLIHEEKGVKFVCDPKLHVTVK
jgi:hypothetical protein